MSRILILLCSFLSYALTVAGQLVINKSTDGKNVGIFYGKIIDGETFKAIEAVTIQLIQNRYDTLSGKKRELTLATQLTDKKGEFNIENLPLTGLFRLKVSCAGYKPFETKISFDNSGQKPVDINSTPHGSIKDLGNFKLFPDPEQLETVVVNANKPLLQMYLDKKVYYVDKDISATGGTAVDVVRNIPGLIVDLDGNINMRNASPQIFIDGRPSTLSLEQIPSDQIASVEIITNPSAKYDASGGGAGIINIILKKARRSGYNGSLRAGIDSRLRPGIGGDINVKQNKINFFAAAQFNSRKNIADHRTTRTDFLSANSSALTDQQNAPVTKGYFGFGKIGFDFLMTNRTTLTVGGNYMRGNFKVKDALYISKDITTNSITNNDSAIRDLRADIDFSNIGASMALKHNFAKAGKEWTADINYNRNHNGNISDYHSRFFDNSGMARPSVGAERAIGGGTTKFYTFQTDFINPLSATQKFETGIRVAHRDYESWNDNYRQFLPSLVYIPLPTTAVKFSFNDIVYAAYGSYSHQIKNFSYQVGLRLESSEYKGNLITKNQHFSNKYPVSLFPSLFLSQQISEKQSIQLNYSRKINRPGFFQILPFIDFSDSLNLSVGNPDLKPEFTHLAELSYNHQFAPKHQLMVTAYSKYSNDLITRYQYKAPNTDPAYTDSVIYNSFANATESYTIGLELTSSNKLTEWWDMTSNFNLFHATLNGNNIAGTSNNNMLSWFAKMNHSFKMPAYFTLQITGEYQAKTILPTVSSRNSSGGFGGGVYGFTQNLAQGYIRPIYGIDIALKKDLFKNKTASVTLQVNDILQSRAYKTHAETAFFVQDNYRLRDAQVFRLNFSWRFGKFDAALSKRKNTKSDNDNPQLQQNGGQ